MPRSHTSNADAAWGGERALPAQPDVAAANLPGNTSGDPAAAAPGRGGGGSTKGDEDFFIPLGSTAASEPKPDQQRWIMQYLQEASESDTSESEVTARA